MDHRRFDALARLLVSRHSRRTALATVLAALVLGDDPDAVVARNNHRHQRRRKQRQRDRQKQRDHCADGLCDGSCITLDQICDRFGGLPCCPNTACSLTAVPGLTTCQSSCETERECQIRFNTKDVRCIVDILACPFRKLCCQPKLCSDTSKCQSGGECCYTPVGDAQLCCLKGQKCVKSVGCRDI